MFLAVFGVCGVFGVEAWPFTGWRLFADARSQHHISWRATFVPTDGTERDLDLSATSFNGTGFLLGRLSQMEVGERNRLCGEWLHASSTDGSGRIIVYRMKTDLGEREGDRGAAAEHAAAFVCEGGRVDDARAETTSAR